MSGTYRALVEIRYAVWVDARTTSIDRVDALAIAAAEWHHRRRHRQDPEEITVVGDIHLTQKCLVLSEQILKVTET